jgi:hypothetical protein
MHHEMRRADTRRIFFARSGGNRPGSNRFPVGKPGDPGSVRRRHKMDKKKIGEGNYEAAAEFQADQHEFARSGKVKGKAREAAEAVDGPEAAELEKARAAAVAGKSA